MIHPHIIIPISHPPRSRSNSTYDPFGIRLSIQRPASPRTLHIPRQIDQLAPGKTVGTWFDDPVLTGERLWDLGLGLRCVSGVCATVATGAGGILVGLVRRVGLGVVSRGRLVGDELRIGVGIRSIVGVGVGVIVGGVVRRVLWVDVWCCRGWVCGIRFLIWEMVRRRH